MSITLDKDINEFFIPMIKDYMGKRGSVSIIVCIWRVMDHLYGEDTREHWQYILNWDEWLKSQ